MRQSLISFNTTRLRHVFLLRSSCGFSISTGLIKQQHNPQIVNNSRRCISSSSRRYLIASRLFTRSIRSNSSSASNATAGGGARANETDEERMRREDAEEEERRQKMEEEAFEQQQYDPNEPLVARVSRILWTSLKVGAATAFVGIVCYAGYTIVTTLLPVGSSSNAIMRKASDAALHDPDVHAYFGEGAKTYGLDPGGRAEGRRYFVPEYKYDDPLTGEKYHRVKFTLEGQRGHSPVKAWVFAEVAASTHEFRYLIVATKDGQRIISIIDRRPPLMTEEERLGRVTGLIQDAGWHYYADTDADVRDQANILGDFWLKVKCIRCDQEPEKCTANGVPITVGSLPVWKTTTLVKGAKRLEELEKMVIPLANPNKKSWYNFWS